MNVAAWLQSLGLERYEPLFRDNEIDWEVLPKLTAEDLKEIGVVAIGHRRKLLDAIAALGGELLRQPPSRRQRPMLRLRPMPSVGSSLSCFAIWSARPRWHLALIRKICGRCSGPITPPWPRWSPGSGAMSPSIWATASSPISAIRRRMSMMPSRRCGPAWRLSTASAGWRAAPRALASRVGIATGLVIVGDLIGSGEAQERGVVGETPNLAARLQEMAPANAVLVAESTRRLVGDLFDYRDLGAVAVKGLAEPVLGWQVLSESTVENRFEALRSATLTPLVGRDEEVELLLRRWARAKDGEGQIVLISGEAGIGKSRIAAALQERLEPERPIRLRYFCSPHRRDSALYPIIAQLERAAGFSREDTPATKLDKLAALLSHVGRQHASRDGRPYSPICWGCRPSERYPPLPDDPRQKRELILAALVRQLESLAQHRPVLFLFEDAHWIEFDLARTAGAGRRARPRLPVLMVVTFRPEFEPPWTGQAQVTSLTLSRLGAARNKALIGRVAGGKTLPPEILDRIVERTDGIPAFYRGADQDAAGGRSVARRGRAIRPLRPTAELAIPSSLHDSLMARLDRLTPVKEIAQIGAAIGREFSL